jgi:hypothetical protein
MNPGERDICHGFTNSPNVNISHLEFFELAEELKPHADEAIDRLKMFGTETPRQIQMNIEEDCYSVEVFKGVLPESKFRRNKFIDEGVDRKNLWRDKTVTNSLCESLSHEMGRPFSGEHNDGPTEIVRVAGELRHNLVNEILIGRYDNVPAHEYLRQTLRSMNRMSPSTVRSR